MAFQEKSAWTMLIALGLISASYVSGVMDSSSALNGLASPNLASHVGYLIALIVLSVIGHIIIAVAAPSEANAPSDERDRRIVERSGRWAGEVLGFGIISGLIVYLVTGSGDLLFYITFGALALSTLLEYLLQILLYRGTL